MEKLTREQAALLGAYTGYALGPFEDIQQKIEQVLGRPVWTHELANKDLCEDVKRRLQDELEAICSDRAMPAPSPSPKD